MSVEVFKKFFDYIDRKDLFGQYESQINDFCAFYSSLFELEVELSKDVKIVDYEFSEPTLETIVVKDKEGRKQRLRVS